MSQIVENPFKVFNDPNATISWQQFRSIPLTPDQAYLFTPDFRDQFPGYVVVSSVSRRGKGLVRHKGNWVWAQDSGLWLKPATEILDIPKGSKVIKYSVSVPAVNGRDYILKSLRIATPLEESRRRILEYRFLGLGVALATETPPVKDDDLSYMFEAPQDVKD
jgi:hypothetical protein